MKYQISAGECYQSETGIGDKKLSVELQGSVLIIGLYQQERDYMIEVLRIIFSVKLVLKT